MGWLHILKKRNEPELEAPSAPQMLDMSNIPELPPFPEGGQKWLPSQTEAKEELPPFPGELPPFPNEGMPSLAEELPAFDKALPPLPKIIFQESLKPIEAVLPKSVKIPLLVLSGRAFERKAAAEEKKQLLAREKHTAPKPIFVDGRDFCKIVGGLSDLHAELLACEAHLGHWLQNDETKVVHLDHLKATLEHMQRKLIYVDKTIFNERW